MSRLKNPLLAAVVVVIMVATWVAFAPRQFGGQVSYVIVAGASMEPILHRGDLAVVRQTHSYEIDDVATYLHPQIGPVIHRIIDREGSRYILKGDNNYWIDSYTPVDDEIVGKLWLHWPNAGSILASLREPSLVALISIGIAVFAAVTLRSGKDRRSIKAPMNLNFRAPNLTSLGAYIEGTVFALAALGLASLLLALTAFRRPIFRPTTDEFSYEHGGEFVYTAAGELGVYDSASVRTGEPIFFTLADSMSVEFNYRFRSEAAENISGTAALFAQISDVSGWKRTLTLQSETEFADESISLQGDLDLGEVVGILQNLEERTGLHRPQFQLAIIPVIQTYASFENLKFNDSFSPRLQFQLDDIQLQLFAENILADESDPLRPNQFGMVQKRRLENNTVNVLSIEFTVFFARIMSSIGLGLALIGFGVVAYAGYQARIAGPAAEIKWRYGSKIVSVKGKKLPPATGRIDVEDIDDLMILAGEKEQPVLHLERGKAHHYYMKDDGVTYYFTLQDNGEGEE
jgi:signal peptidase